MPPQCNPIRTLEGAYIYDYFLVLLKMVITPSRSFDSLEIYAKTASVILAIEDLQDILVAVRIFKNSLNRNKRG